MLRAAHERLDEATREKIYTRLPAADTHDDVASAWYAIDLLRRTYQAPPTDRLALDLMGTSCPPPGRSPRSCPRGPLLSTCASGGKQEWNR